MSAEKAETPAKSGKKSPSRIVCIGASAGGLQAIEQFLSAMSPDSGMGFVVIQHLSPNFKSMLHELIGRFTSMAVSIAEDGVFIEENTVHVIPPQCNLQLENGCIKLTKMDSVRSPNFPIDTFLKSLAEDQKEKSVGIILSGTGSDGSRGVKSIAEAGGHVFVQDPETSAFDGMPHNAIQSVSPTGKGHPIELPRLMEEAFDPELVAKIKKLRKPIDTVFSIVERHCGIDFSKYKPATIERRIQRRVEINKKTNFETYLEYLETHPEECDDLYRDLLIGVTHFFRDAASFDLLRTRVLPQIFANSSSSEEIRVWVCGCASGEEAYSIAILFAEVAEELNATNPIRIFATDAHRDSIEFASLGRYNAEHVTNVPGALLEKYFKCENNHYKVVSSIRKMVVFSRHNAVSDPPFTQLSLVSCRNLLIYLNEDAQRRVLGMFHFSLKTNFYMFLGSSETLGSVKNAFETIDHSARLFKKVDAINRLTNFRILPKPEVSIDAKSERIVTANAMPYLNRELMRAYDLILGKYVPPSLLINKQRELLHVFGEAGLYIKRTQGRPSLDILTSLEGELLRSAVTSAVNSATRERVRVRIRDVKWTSGEENHLLDVTVDPLVNSPEDAIEVYLILFEKVTEVSAAPVKDIDKFDAERVTAEQIHTLELELRYAREHLQTTIEELESSNEELQASNEEMLASNEELQSTNEELHSTNEELFTVNTEYERKNVELTHLNNDIDNLLKSTEIGTVFVDKNLRIRKFTPAIAHNFNLLDSDIGRPFDHITFNLLLGGDDLSTKATVVMESRVPFVCETRDKEGRWLLVRILPYLTARGDCSGAVLTLVDLTVIKEAERELFLQSEQLKLAKEDLESFAYAVSHKLQSPLRMISNYVKLLEEELGDQVRNELREYVNFAMSGATELRDQINALLSYTRIETRGKPFKDISLKTLLSRVEKSMSQRLKGIIVEKNIAVDTVFGDELQIELVLSELIENAQKFRSDSEPTISITAEERDGGVQICVRDNGIGIEHVIQEQVFELFYKGHPDSEYKGLGVGLSICKRIVLRHLGRISLDSTIGRGTAVTLVLPIPEVFSKNVNQKKDTDE